MLLRVAVCQTWVAWAHGKHHALKLGLIKAPVVQDHRGFLFAVGDRDATAAMFNYCRQDLHAD